MEALRVYGAALSPMSAWQILQGVETLHVRMERHCANARRVADFLRAHPRVSWVNYPGLADHPQHALVAKQMRQIDGAPGASGLLAFGVKGGLPAGVKFIEAAQFMNEPTYTPFLNHCLKLRDWSSSAFSQLVSNDCG